MKLYNGMTKESLSFVIKCVLEGVIEKLEENFPNEMSFDRRCAFFPTEDVTGFTDQEDIIIDQGLNLISIIVAQSIEDSITGEEVDNMLGDFSSACNRFVSSNWQNKGIPFMQRYNKAMENNIFLNSSYLWSEIDVEAFVNRFMFNLEEWQTDDDD